MDISQPPPELLVHHADSQVLCLLSLTLHKLKVGFVAYEQLSGLLEGLQDCTASGYPPQALLLHCSNKQDHITPVLGMMRELRLSPRLYAVTLEKPGSAAFTAQQRQWMPAGVILIGLDTQTSALDACQQVRAAIRYQTSG